MKDDGGTDRGLVVDRGVSPATSLAILLAVTVILVCALAFFVFAGG